MIAHQAAVANLSYGLARRLSHAPGELLDVIEAALIHDAYKRREFENNEKAKREGQSVEAANRESELASAQFLNELGFPKNVVMLSKATGDLGLQRMTQNDVQLAEKIIFYADCCASNDLIVGYQKRFDDLLPHFEPGGRYEWVNAAYQKRWGKTHREKWDEVVLPLQEKLSKLTGFEGNSNELHIIGQ